ncbi:hypothetical protein L1887_14150 [Cichorium endivia]|nr:hypothetical protein L1887_14150 [Cichorium endivia]
MTSQYKNPRLLILGGSLDLRSHNQLASIKTLLQQENQISLFEDLMHQLSISHNLSHVSGPSGVNLGNLLEQTFTEDKAAG